MTKSEKIKKIKKLYKIFKLYKIKLDKKKLKLILNFLIENFNIFKNNKYKLNEKYFEDLNKKLNLKNTYLEISRLIHLDLKKIIKKWKKSLNLN